MDKTVSFRADSRKVEELDRLAEAQDRDRSYLLNEAIDYYLDLQQYHIQAIREGIRDADAGNLVPHEEVIEEVKKLRRKK